MTDYAQRDLSYAKDILDAANGEHKSNPTRETLLDLIEAQNRYRDAFKRANQVAAADVQSSIYDSLIWSDSPEVARYRESGENNG